MGNQADHAGKRPRPDRSGQGHLILQFDRLNFGDGPSGVVTQIRGDHGATRFRIGIVMGQAGKACIPTACAIGSQIVPAGSPVKAAGVPAISVRTARRKFSPTLSKLERLSWGKDYPAEPPLKRLQLE